MNSYQEFWPYYLGEHRNRWCRWLHFTGTSLALIQAIVAIYLMRPKLLLLVPVWGYGLAWIGHVFFEKNIPATLKYPWWSLRGDFQMYILMCRGKLL